MLRVENPQEQVTQADLFDAADTDYPDIKEDIPVPQPEEVKTNSPRSIKTHIEVELNDSHASLGLGVGSPDTSPLSKNQSGSTPRIFARFEGNPFTPETLEVKDIPNLETPEEEDIPNPKTHAGFVSELQTLSPVSRNPEAKAIRKKINERQIKRKGSGYCIGLGMMLWYTTIKKDLGEFKDILQGYEEKCFGDCSFQTTKFLGGVEETQWAKYHGFLMTDGRNSSAIPEALKALFYITVDYQNLDSVIDYECKASDFKENLRALENGALMTIGNIPPKEQRNCSHGVHIIKKDDNNFIFYNANLEPHHEYIEFTLEESDDIFYNQLIPGLYDDFDIKLANKNLIDMERIVYRYQVGQDCVKEEIEMETKDSARSMRAAPSPSS